MTTSLDKLYGNQNYVLSAATLERTFMSGLRLEEINVFRNKIIKQLSVFFKVMSDYFKKVCSLSIAKKPLSP